jgi:hypothetical protein
LLRIKEKSTSNKFTGAMKKKEESERCATFTSTKRSAEKTTGNEKNSL